MNKLLILFFLTIVSIDRANCQTATIKAPVTYPYIEDTAKSTFNRFTINGHSFGEKDTIIKVRINSNGFDSCVVLIAKDTLRFLTKFKAGEMYEIEQGCCCAAFTMKAKNNAGRGTVMYTNKTNRDQALVIAEANIDTVRKGKTHTTFASESMMCYFKPCSILVTETEYLSGKYEYQSDNRDYDKLSEEQAKYILAKTWFHFLHGEKIAVEYNKKTGAVRVKLTGYLTKSEEKKWRGF